MWNYINYNELYHHGVPGMKWGIRKARNLIGGAARVRSEYSNLNPKHTSSNIARKFIGNAFMKAAYGKSQGPQRLSGKRELAAKIGRKILGRKTVRAQAATYKYTKSGIKLASNASELLKHMHLTFKNRLINVGGNDFRRLSRSTKIRNIVNKYLNSMGSRKFNDYGKPTRIIGMNKVLSSGKNLGYSFAYDSIRFASKKNPRFKRLR